MNIIKSLFKRKEKPIQSYGDFWKWFNENERVFFKVVKEEGNIEKVFFDILSEKLNELKEGFYYLTGMFDKDTVELIITAEGAIKNIVFVEELVKSAPEIKGWKFTALKPALETKDVSINMSGYKFNKGNLSFYSNNHIDFPDEIDITIVHDELNEENKAKIINGIYIFLDNYLGELELALTIDNLKFLRKADAEKELIPIEKLKDFLKWRQKEFIEKYNGIRHDIENDNYYIIETELKNGKHLISVINTDVLNWDNKASHPWILAIELHYEDGNNGMPDPKTLKLLSKIEDQINEELKDFEGYLNIGRETGDGVREIYFACKDFRKPSKSVYEIQKDYSDKFEIHFEIYKDKYWQTFNRFLSKI
jgi:hypothetical protein